LISDLEEQGLIGNRASGFVSQKRRQGDRAAGTSLQVIALNVRALPRLPAFRRRPG
jgi:hypothetical protein